MVCFCALVSHPAALAEIQARLDEKEYERDSSPTGSLYCVWRLFFGHGRAEVRRSEDLADIGASAYLCLPRPKPFLKLTGAENISMTEKEIIQIENEIFTALVIDTLKQQRADGVPVKEYLLDRYEVERITKERLKKILSESRT